METFSSLLRNIIEANDFDVVIALRTVNNEGVKVSRASFYRYLSGESVPSLTKAISMIKALGYEFANKEDLAEILNNSSQLIETDHLKHGMLWTSIKVNYHKFVDSPNAEEIFWNRVKQTSGGVTDYITKLIKKDLNESVLEKGKDYGSEEIL